MHAHVHTAIVARAERINPVRLIAIATNEQRAMLREQAKKNTNMEHEPVRGMQQFMFFFCPNIDRFFWHIVLHRVAAAFLP